MKVRGKKCRNFLEVRGKKCIFAAVNRQEFLSIHLKYRVMRRKIIEELQYHGKVIPVEVKAEENLRSKSLKAFMSSHSDLKAIRFSMSGYIDQEWLTNVPLYGIPFAFTRF